MSSTPRGRTPGWVEHGLGALFATLYVAVLLHTAPAIGLSRDEGIYVVAAESYAHWFELLVNDPKLALQPDVIDRFYRVNHEHPPLMKTLFAWSYLLDRKYTLFEHESQAFRFPGMLSAGLLLWLILVFGTRLYGRRAGIFAALAFALLPRPFYHAHLDAFDIPITLAVTAVTYAYYRSLSQRSYALWCGVLFGLALATKLNSFFLPGIFGLHFVWMVAFARKARRAGARQTPSAVPYWLLSMVVLGPPIFYASWPWVWHETLRRLNSYASFHLHHDYYNMAYFGVNYFLPPFPVSYPFVMTLYTVPVTTLLVAVLGITVACKIEIASLRGLFAGDAEAIEQSDPVQTTVLLLGCLMAPIVIIALPSTPIFGGTKHWFTAYPFLVLFAGYGFDRALTAYAHLLPQRLSALRAHVAWPVGALLLTPALVETVHSHPFGLSHYGFAAGFVPGSADRGMNRQFWGFTTGSLVSFFNQHLPKGGRVYACDTLDVSFRMLARDGLLLDNIRSTNDVASADYAIVHHEHHMAEVDYEIWTLFGTTQPVYVLTYDGVPIVSVYENPRHAAARARARGRR